MADLQEYSTALWLTKEMSMRGLAMAMNAVPTPMKVLSAEEKSSGGKLVLNANPGFSECSSSRSRAFGVRIAIRGAPWVAEANRVNTIKRTAKEGAAKMAGSVVRPQLKNGKDEAAHELRLSGGTGRIIIRCIQRIPGSPM